MDLLASRAKWRTLVILGLMYAILLQLAYVVALVAGVQIGLEAILFVSIAALLVDAYSYLQCDKLVLKATHARVVTAEEAPMLHSIIEELCIASGLPKPTIAIVDDPSLNAFATGRDPHHAAVAVNTGLLEALNKNELRGVLGHEMGHIYNRDIFVNSVAAVCVRIVSAIANGFIYAGIAALTAPSRSGFKTQDEQNAENSRRAMGLGLLLTGAVLAITFVPALLLLQFAISRTRESMADLTGIKFTKDPEALSSALSIITGSTVPTRLKAAGTSHMWISKPVFAGGGLGNWVSSLTSSHPDPKTRIATVDAVANGQSVDLAMSHQMQSLGPVFFAGVVAVALVAIPGYWIGTNPLHAGSNYSNTYGTDYGNSSGTDSGSGSVAPQDTPTPDAVGGLGSGTTDSSGTPTPDAAGGLGNGTADSSGGAPTPDAAGGIGSGSTDTSGGSADSSGNSNGGTDPGATGGIG